MSSLIDSLKKQNEFLQSEIERYAGGVDRLAAELAEARKELEALRAEAEPEQAAAPAHAEA